MAAHPMRRAVAAAMALLALALLATGVAVHVASTRAGREDVRDDAGPLLLADDRIFQAASITDRAVPLVVDLHGSGGTPASERHDFRIDQLARDAAWHALWPAGYRRTWNAAPGMYPPASWARVNHTHVLHDEIEAVRQAVHVSDVHLVGYSNGCAMLHRLITELPGYFSADVCLAHHRPASLARVSQAAPVRFMTITGALDETFASRDDMAATMRAMAVLNGCSNRTTTNATSPAYSVTASVGCNAQTVHVRMRSVGHFLQCGRDCAAASDARTEIPHRLIARFLRDTATTY